MSKHNNNLLPSATKCWGCKRHLSIGADIAGMRYCPDCCYFHAKGIYTTEQYNNYLKNSK